MPYARLENRYRCKHAPAPFRSQRILTSSIACGSDSLSTGGFTGFAADICFSVPGCSDTLSSHGIGRMMLAAVALPSRSGTLRFRGTGRMMLAAAALTTVLMHWDSAARALRKRPVLSVKSSSGRSFRSGSFCRCFAFDLIDIIKKLFQLSCFFFIPDWIMSFSSWILRRIQRLPAGQVPLQPSACSGLYP